MDYFKHNGASVKEQYYIVTDGYAARIMLDAEGNKTETEMDVNREHFDRSCYSPIKEEDVTGKKTTATKSTSKNKDE